VDAVVLVAEALALPRAACREALVRLESTGARVLGVILNKVPGDRLGPFTGAAGRAIGSAALALLVIAVACTSAAPPPVPEGVQSAPPPTPSVPPPTQLGAVLPRWESVEAARGEGVAEYRLAAGDVVDIMVFGHDDMRKELPVRPDGRISYLLVGDLQAAGRTVEELRATLETALTKSLRYPQVDVVLKKARQASFSVLGEVVQPGVYPIEGATTLVEGIALAQGLASGQYEGSTIETADLAHAFLVRRGKVVPVDFERVIHRGDTSQDVELEDGDFVYIPSSLAQEVYVLGEVFDPRSFGFRGRVTLLQAVAESGGFRPEARLGDVVVLRGVYGEKRLLPVDVREIIAGRGADPELEVGDVVYVPRRRLTTAADTLRDILSILLVYQSVQSLSSN
jgi:polysaccharide export outer membrane protein